MNTAEQVIRKYYAAFNAWDLETFFSLLDDDVAHDINQNGRKVGKAEFRKFMEHMGRCYKEEVVDLVVFTEPTASRGAAEFVIKGRYLTTDGGLPPAKGQEYRLPVGAFFEIANGKVKRISNHYNLQDWINQVAK